MFGGAVNSWKLNGVSLLAHWPRWSWTLRYKHIALALPPSHPGLFWRTFQLLHVASCSVWSLDFGITSFHLFSAFLGCGLSVSLSLEW